MSASQEWLLGPWIREFPFEGHLLACYWTLSIEATPMMKGHKMLMESEIAIMSGMMPEDSKGDGSGQKSDIIKCIRFIFTGSCWLQNARRFSGTGSLLSPTTDWNWERTTVTCTAPCKQFLTGQQRTAWLRMAVPRWMDNLSCLEGYPFDRGS